MSKKRKSPQRLTGANKALAREQIRKMAEAELENIRNTVSDQISEYAIVASAVAAYDVCGLKGWELVDFCKKFLLQFECLGAGTVKLEDLRGMLALEAKAELHSLETLRETDKPILIGSGAFQVICWKDEKLTIPGWAEKYGLKPQTVRGRLARGWDIERALTTPAKGVVKDAVDRC